MLRENFSARITELRKESNLTQEALGKAIGISPDAIYTFEKGKRLASTETLVALADYFNVSLDYITGRSDSRER